MKTIHLRPNLAMNWRLYRLMLVKSPSQGFTMLEVLVAILMVFGFLMGTLNAMLAATVMQVKAERQAQATYWIQQDLENVRATADTFPANTALCGATTFAAGYATALKTVVDSLAQPTIPDILNLPNKIYTMTRTTGGSNPNVLTISYTVSNAGDPDAIATLYTEVIPTEALSCP